MNHCLVTGGSSQIGYFLLPELLEGDTNVQLLALARRQRPGYLSAHQRLQWSCDHDVVAGLPPASQMTDIISLGPLQLTLKQLSLCPALRRVVAVSSSSILVKQDSAAAHERKQIRGLAAAEQTLIERCQQRNIICQVLRPTLIYGAGLDANVCALARLVQRFGVIPVAGRAAGLRRPVHAADIAEAILRLRQLEQSGVWTVTGGSALSYRQMAVSVCKALSRGRVIGVPNMLLQTALSAAHLTGRLRAVNAAMIERQNQHLLLDDQSAKTDWGWSPRPFQLTPAMLRAPQRPWQK